MNYRLISDRLQIRLRNPPIRQNHLKNPAIYFSFPPRLSSLPSCYDNGTGLGLF